MFSLKSAMCISAKTIKEIVRIALKLKNDDILHMSLVWKKNKGLFLIKACAEGGDAKHSWAPRNDLQANQNHLPASCYVSQPPQLTSPCLAFWSRITKIWLLHRVSKFSFTFFRENFVQPTKMLTKTKIFVHFAKMFVKFFSTFRLKS